MFIHSQAISCSHVRRPRPRKDSLSPEHSTTQSTQAKYTVSNVVAPHGPIELMAIYDTAIVRLKETTKQELSAFSNLYTLAKDLKERCDSQKQKRQKALQADPKMRQDHQERYLHVNARRQRSLSSPC
jgi:hypothetical protein